MNAKRVVKWLWKGDDDWSEYDAKLAARLESVYRQGKKDCKVDDERFVDFKEMLQRRYDDVMKRRPVKREVPPILENEMFFVVLPAKQKKELEETIDEYGGLIASTLNKKVTHIIMREADLPKKKKEVDKAKELKIPIVSSEFLDKCTAELDVVDDGPFRLDETEEEEEEEEDAKTSTTAKGKEKDTDNKRKAEPPKKGDDSAQQPEKKKVKVDETLAGDPAEIYLQPKSCFSGTSEQEGFDSCPFMLTILERSGDSFNGQIVWATLQTTTKFKASLDGDLVTIEEYELVSGDDVEVPNKYSGSLAKDGSLKGKLVDSHGEEGTFELKNISLPKVETYKDSFRPNTLWNGICYTPFPFALQIEKRQKNSFTGVMTWPTIENSQTKVRGTITDGKLEFEEFEVIKGVDDVDVPNLFTATLSNETATSAEGTFKGVGNPDLGKFTIAKSS